MSNGAGTPPQAKMHLEPTLRKMRASISFILGTPMIDTPINGEHDVLSPSWKPQESHGNSRRGCHDGRISLAALDDRVAK